MSNSIQFGTIVPPVHGKNKGQRIARGDARHEAQIRIITWVMIVSTMVMLISLYVSFSRVGHTDWSRPSELRDATVELVTIHHAATQAGILQVRSDNPAYLQDWLQEPLGYTPVVPDLSGIGLYPQGARLLSMAQSDWPLIQYADQTGQWSDVFLVAAPTGEVGAPSESVMETVAGTEAYLDRVRDIGVMYLTVGDTDWMIVSSETDSLLRSLASALVDRLG